MNYLKSNLTSVFFISALLMACNPSGGNQNSANDSPNQSEQAASELQKETTHSEEDISPVLDAYMKIKQALVETDSEKASKAADELVATIEHQSDELYLDILTSSKTIAEANEIEDQREAFEDLSTSVYQMVKATKSGSIGIYKQFCPMAFDNQGAFWLSFEEEIRNPYFGDKMLKCGKVMESL